MKKLLCFVYLLSFVSFGQIKSGTITYEISYEFDDDLRTGMMSEYVQRATQNAKYYTFNLDFNQEAMRFYPLENMSVDTEKNNFVLAFCACDGVYYKVKNFTETLHEFYNENFGFLILKQENKFEWELTSETKMINDFLCYRANTKKIIDNGGEIFTLPIIAWYCPQIPFPYGPKDYGGLPGLILELQERDVLFGVKKIKLDKTENILIQKPTKGKLITESEYNKMSDEYAESLKKEN